NLVKLAANLDVFVGEIGEPRCKGSARKLVRAQSNIRIHVEVADRLICGSRQLCEAKDFCPCVCSVIQIDLSKSEVGPAHYGFVDRLQQKLERVGGRRLK